MEGIMDEQLLERAASTVKYYRDEIEHWRQVPTFVVQSRERLARLIVLDHTFSVDREIALLRRHVNWLKQHRLGVIIH
jgi:hypothetical protein